MALSDGRTRSTRLAFQQVDPVEHVTLPAETGSIPEVEEEEEEEADTDELPPNSVWHRTLTVEEEDFLRDVGKAVKGMEPGVLERWIVKNEAMYDRRNVKHWHNLSWDNAEYRDRHLSAGEGRELPERILEAYRSIILKELRETESPPSVQEEPEGTADLPGPNSGVNKQADTTLGYSPDVPARQPASTAAGQVPSQAGVRAAPLQGQEPHQHGASEVHGSTGNGAAVYWQSTLVLLQREYAMTLSRMERLSLESQQPHSVERARLMWQEWRFFEDTLVGLREHLRWYSMYEASPLQMCVSVAHGIAPVPPGAGRSAAGGLGLSGPPGMAPGMNFASFGAHSGYQFGAPANSARR
ncbi:MAG: hypothetical protein BYD32DRAFT_457710 [Podila humilis]|nr:MAG: hypothetical protein BYD32DRAFT_457710 [Podila humilis]